jgi:hypothetical protein
MARRSGLSELERRPETVRVEENPEEILAPPPDICNEFKAGNTSSSQFLCGGTGAC